MSLTASTSPRGGWTKCTTSQSVPLAHRYVTNATAIDATMFQMRLVIGRDHHLGGMARAARVPCPTGLLSGMARRSEGRSPRSTSSHRPSVVHARNQRPEIITYSSSSVGSLNTFAVVFSTYSSDVPSTVTNRGGPLVTINSAGFVEMKITGAVASSSFGVLPGFRDVAPSKRSTVFATAGRRSASSAPGGGTPATDHIPVRPYASIHPSNTFMEWMP